MMKYLLLIPFPVLFLSACSSDSGNGSMADLLQGALAENWQVFTAGKPGFSGGLAMEIISPKGEYFISAGMPSDITNRFHFRIASCTKTFTAAAIMLLHQQGRLNIDDLVTSNIPGTDTPYLPADANYAVPYKDQITIRMLLMHRAGVFDVANSNVPEGLPVPYAGKNYCFWVLNSDPNHQFSFDEFVGVVALNGLYDFMPGQAYHYSNMGYVMLGKIIERVSGRGYADYIMTELVGPNGMNETSVPTDALDNALPAPFSTGYEYDGSNSRDVTIANISLDVADGNIISTVHDLSTWWRRLVHGDAGLRADMVEMMMNGLPKEPGLNEYYGLGMEYSSAIGYGHKGAREGYLTSMYYFPDKDVVYVMYTNIWDKSGGYSSMLTEINTMFEIANKVISRLGY